MADAYDYVVSTGLIVPDTAATLAQVQQEYKDAFQDQDLVVTPDTPQGVLITSESINRNNSANNNCVVANQFNPNYSGGVFLDAILALTGVQRTGQKPTIVEGVLLTGTPGTNIPSGSLAKTAAGDLFQSLTIATLDVSGNATVDFQSLVSDAIPCAISALDMIVTGIIGWETVSNPVAGILGAGEQSDQQARAYRKNTLAFQGVALPVAITSALYAVVGVQSLTFQENIAATTQTINGISMVAHSVYACVNGGSDVDVAAALLENKSSGAAWNGGTTVNIVEPASGQSYAVKFDRPDEIGILVRVTVSNATTDAVKKAVVDYADGLINNVQGFVVGSDVSPFEISAAIVAENPGSFVSKVEVSYSSSPSYTTNSLAIAVDEIAATQISYVTVVIV